MTPYEFADKWKLSIKKVRQMMKVNNWPQEKENVRADAIRHLISKGQPLTAAHLCELVDSPELVLDLGKYAGRAQEQIDALGKAKEQAAPKEVTAYIGEAARGDTEAVGILSAWLKEIIPSRPVNHSFIAVRLLLGLAPSIRAFDVPRIPRALHECRKVESFAAWFVSEPKGARNQTIYKKPKKDIANFDL